MNLIKKMDGYSMYFMLLSEDTVSAYILLMKQVYSYNAAQILSIFIWAQLSMSHNYTWVIINYTLHITSTC